ncbi:MAG: LuxR family transcriptional regulator [Comamonadaceae bacterium]|nr:MAG: LuxR family transcriptional regulator [Comamonadaceae bacterium]
MSTLHRPASYRPIVQAAAQIPVFDAIKALAFVGDLSMGQPVDHSARTAWIASRLAAAVGRDATLQGHAACVALLRWSGCTANASEFAELLGDDVGGRRVMLSSAWAGASAESAGALGMLAAIHCEVSGEIAQVLGMPNEVEQALRHIFEHHDGSGKPGGLAAPHIPEEVFFVSLAGDLEIFSRVHGPRAATRLIGERAGSRYPAALADALAERAVDWLHALDRGAAADLRSPCDALGGVCAPLELIADVIDLKLPWMTGFSRRVAEAATGCAVALGLDSTTCGQIHRAALIHGIGRASVPNTVWDASGEPGVADQERLRLVPYWTQRAAGRIEALRAEAEIASFVDERLDGSGSFRGARAAAIELPARVLAGAVHAVLLRTASPGRPALSEQDAAVELQLEARLGRLDPEVVAVLTGQRSPPSTGPADPSAILSGREIEVLARISLGESNKEAARVLGISPSTVRAHLENIFRKLGCTTRAAATLKAMTRGLF